MDEYRLDRLERWREAEEAATPTAAVIVERLSLLSKRVDTLVRVFVALTLALIGVLGGLIASLILLIVGGGHG